MNLQGKGFKGDTNLAHIINPEEAIPVTGNITTDQVTALKAKSEANLAAFASPAYESMTSQEPNGSLEDKEE
jgi:hypothetical protein